MERPLALFSTTLLTLALALLIGIGTPIRANAASKGVSQGKVLGACKRTAGCWTRNEPGGTVIGCSPQACFSCLNGKCVAMSKGKPGGGATMGGVKLPPGAVQSASGRNESADPVHHPVDFGAAQESTQSRSMGGSAGGMHHFGRGR